jgi:hypothetical protein
LAILQPSSKSKDLNLAEIDGSFVECCLQRFDVYNLFINLVKRWLAASVLIAKHEDGTESTRPELASAAVSQLSGVARGSADIQLVKDKPSAASLSPAFLDKCAAIASSARLYRSLVSFDFIGLLCCFCTCFCYCRNRSCRCFVFFASLYCQQPAHMGITTATAITIITVMVAMAGT